MCVGVHPYKLVNYVNGYGGEGDEQFVLIIDEMNRGSLPHIFGETLSLLSNVTRDKRVTLAKSGETLLCVCLSISIDLYKRSRP
jgi:hypothetical protein